MPKMVASSISVHAGLQKRCCSSGTPSDMKARYAFSILGTPQPSMTRGFTAMRWIPHAMITQIMADPNRDRASWLTDKAAIAKATGFAGEIKRSKIV
jgi:hypothetical protein